MNANKVVRLRLTVVETTHQLLIVLSIKYKYFGMPYFNNVFIFQNYNDIFIINNKIKHIFILKLTLLYTL